MSIEKYFCLCILRVNYLWISVEKCTCQYVIKYKKIIICEFQAGGFATNATSICEFQAGGFATNATSICEFQAGGFATNATSICEFQAGSFATNATSIICEFQAGGFATNATSICEFQAGGFANNATSICEFQAGGFATNATSMERMRKLLSPGTRKKNLSHRTFGVPLEDIVARAPGGSKVPYLVSRVCEHIQSRGECTNFTGQ